MTNEPEIQNVIPTTTCEVVAPVVPFTTPTRRRYWGKIPNLPTRIRLFINQSLRDGVSYPNILEALAKRGADHITKDNLVHWNQTGYQDWLKDQKDFEKIVLTSDKAVSRKTTASTKKNIRAMSQLDISVQLYDAARQFNTERLRELLDDKPEVFLRLIQVNALHERNAILRDCADLEVKKYTDKSKTQKRAKAPKRIPTPEELKAIKTRLRI